VTPRLIWNERIQTSRKRTFGLLIKTSRQSKVEDLAKARSLWELS